MQAKRTKSERENESGSEDDRETLCEMREKDEEILYEVMCL